MQTPHQLEESYLMKHSTTRGNLIRKIVYITLSAVFWTALWDFLSYKVSLELLLPSPYQTFKRLIELSGQKQFWISVSTSLINTLSGFAVGVVFGTFLAVLTAFIKSANTLLSPINTVIRATPVASFIILALIWIDSKNVPFFISFLMVTPIIWNTLKTAILKVDPDLKQMARSYNVSLPKQILHLYFPSVFPQYITSMITSIGLSWKASIAAEVLCRPETSIGTSIYNSKLYLESTDLFAYTATVIIFSVIMEMIFSLVMNKLVKGGKSL